MAKRRYRQRARRAYARVKRVGHKKSSIVGGMSLKGLVMGAAMLTVGKVAINMLAPGLPFQRPLGAVAGGALAGATGLPGKQLIGFGVMDAGSDIISSLISGGGFGLKTGGGYEF